MHIINRLGIATLGIVGLATALWSLPASAQSTLDAVKKRGEDWAYNIVKQVGNYSESYERNLGMGSSLKLARRISALWNQGGQMYPPPLR